eukprot:GSChrysophyteH2.ASY1.ANO1.1732.1 assembled CDS
MKNFNSTEYISHTWYIQQQQITEYQPKNSFFCVTQTLEDNGNHVPLFKGPVISVYNFANTGKVNGPLQNADNTTLCARQADKDTPSNILNAPCFLPNAAAGPYWVIQAGPSDANYEWAIVAGGPPTVQYDDGCTNTLDGVNGSGLWLYTRDPLDSSEYVPVMRKMLSGMGYTLSQLYQIEQHGCSYKGAFLK